MGDRVERTANPLTRLGRTVGDLRRAVADGRVVKTELQLFGLDWAQLDDEPDGAPLAEAFARHGAVVETAVIAPDATGGPDRLMS